MADKQSQPRSVAEIQAEIAGTRARLASSVSDLIDDVHPKNVKARAVTEAKEFVSSEFNHAKEQIKDDDGWRVDRLVAIGGAVVGVIAFVLTVRAITKGRRKPELDAVARYRELTDK